MYLYVLCYCDACLKSSALRVGVKTLNNTQCEVVAWAAAEIFPGGGKVDILLIRSMLLTMQCKCTFQNALPFPHHNENAPCYSSSCENLA